MSGRLANKVAIITGSSSGIGRAMALMFHREGAAVVCSDIREISRDEGSAECEISTHALIEKEGGKVLFVKTDVTNEEEVKSLVQKAVEKFGRLDIMVNNAGVAIEAYRPIWETPTDTWDKVIEINVKGVFLGCKHAINQMIKQEPHASGDRGWIVNLASILGLVGISRGPAYSTSKHAVMGITRSAALDCAPHRIHVNAICPGFVDTAMPAVVARNPETAPRLTAMHPFRGLGNPDDIARAAVFLASEDNTWITGIGMPVDGGYTAM